MSTEEKDVLKKDLKDLTKEEIEILDSIADKDIVIEDDDDLVLANADEDDEQGDQDSKSDTSSEGSDDKKDQTKDSDIVETINNDSKPV